MLHEILHDDVKLVGVGERKASLHEHILHFHKRQLKGDGKCNDRGLRRLIGLVRADLREELPVNIRLLIALFSPFVKRENEQIIAPFSTLMYNELRIDNKR